MTLHGKSDFADVIRVKDPEMGDNLGLPRWAPCNLKDLYKRVVGVEEKNNIVHGIGSVGGPTEKVAFE